MSLIELLLKLIGRATSCLAVQVLFLEVVVVEFVVEIFVVVDPGADHVGVLFVEMNGGGLSV